MNIEEIKQVLPHRYPFLLVDKINSIETGKSIEGIKNVSINEMYFQGHFPEESVMPGVLIIEALAQVGAVLLLLMNEFKKKTVYLVGIEKAHFYKKVLPGDALILKANILSRRNEFVKFSVQAETNGEKCVIAELTCAIK